MGALKVCVIGGLFLALGVAVGPRLVMDGPAHTFLWGIHVLAREDRSVYAPGYSDWRFLRVRKGMSCEDVRVLVGDPLTIADISTDPWLEQAYGSGSVVWHYTTVRGRNRSSRVVLFRDCVVLRRGASYAD